MAINYWVDSVYQNTFWSAGVGRDAGIETVCLGQWRVKAYSNSRSHNGNGFRNQSMLFFLKICGWATIARGVQKQTSYVCNCMSVCSFLSCYIDGGLFCSSFSTWWVAVLGDMFIHAYIIIYITMVYADIFATGNSEYVHDIEHNFCIWKFI